LRTRDGTTNTRLTSTFSGPLHSRDLDVSYAVGLALAHDLYGIE
jgi:hypothetical protein